MLLKSLVLFAFVACAGGDYLGRLCGTQWGQLRYYPGTGSQVQECITYCNNQDYKYAGLIFGEECFCDQTLGGPNWSYPVCAGDGTGCPSNCTSPGFPCAADPTMTCGDTKWHSLYDAGTDWDIITHWETIVSDVCSQNQPNCSWYCKVDEQTYSYPTGLLYGTNIYDIKSSYCLAAAHDLRYQPNILTKVVIERQEDPVAAQLEGAWRFGIDSSWDSTKNVFHVTEPNVNYQFPSVGLWGFGDLSTKEISCAMENSSSSVGQFLSTLGGVTQHDSTNVPFPSANLYYCGLNQTVSPDARWPATYVPVVTQPVGNEKAVNNRTIVVMVGQDAKWTFNSAGLPNSPFTVEKESHVIVPPASGDVAVDVSPATLPHGGFYDLVDNTKSRVATVRLIVLDANYPVGKCGIQGVEREDGTCLCFPPFGNAANCQGICNLATLDGTFGENCDVTCGANNCKGKIVCGEDPFGCHCASGWTGDDCNTECPPETWGPECQGHATGCHCIGGGSCDRITGSCPKGCEWGWYGLSCNQQGPYLLHAPQVVNEYYSSLNVCWDAWNKSRDGGSFTPDGYYLDYKVYETPDYDFRNSSNGFFAYVSGQSKYCYVQNGLQPVTQYVWRVQTSYKNVAQPQPSPKAYGTTTCDIPTETPNPTASSSAAREITVTWDWPAQSTWHCNQISIQCDFSCHYGCGPFSATGSFSDTITSPTSSGTHDVTVPSFSTCTFTCDFYNPSGHGTQGASNSIAPMTGVPGAVRNFNCYNNPSGLLCAWTLPWGEDGRIDFYDFTSGPANGAQTSVNVTGDTTFYMKTGLSAGTTYSVSVAGHANEGTGAAVSGNFTYSP